MTPQELKSSILQLAIQGKLVEQRPEEGTAEELYQQIQAEKQKLIKTGELKRTKSLAEITSEIMPCDFPESWKVCHIDDIAFVTKLAGFEYTKNVAPNLVEKGIPLFKGKNVQNGRLICSFESYIPESVSNELPRSQINRRCLLTPYVGTIGNIAIFDGSFRAHLGSNVGKIELLNKNDLHVMEEYVLYYFRSTIGYSELTKYKKATAQESISIDAIRNVIIAIPPLAEQKRIVAKIEELLPYIDRYEQAWSKLEDFNKRFPVDMQKSILQMAIQGKLVEQRPGEGSGDDIFKKLKPYHRSLKPCKDELNFSAMDFDIPENWLMVELNQVLDFVDYRGKTPTKITEGVFLITASNIKKSYMDYTRKEYISHEEYQNRQSRGLTQKGDLLFTTEAPMGNAALCDLDECSCGQRIITFKEYTEGTALPALFMYFILSPQFQQQLLDNCTGTTAKGIKADKLKHFLIPLPPYEEQKRIVARLEELLPLCERLK